MNKAENVSELATWVDRAILLWLFVFAIFAPHSIAVTQAAWLLGLLFWVLRLFLYPRPKTYKTPIDYAMLGFFLLTGLSALLSYEPMVSVGKLRAASLFTIVYLVAENVPSRKIVRVLALTMVASCLINVFYTAATRVVGRGVKLEGIKVESPFSSAVLLAGGVMKRFPIIDGDTVLSVDGQPVRNAEEIATALHATPNSRNALIRIYRGDEFPPLQVPRGRLLPGSTPEEQLGVSRSSIGRDWRATGFFGHYVTYAEGLQLIISLALGLFICLPQKKGLIGSGLLFAIAGLAFALILTVTRASWLAFLISATVMILLGTSRRTILIAGACVIPVVLGGLILLQHYRHVSFFDQKDPSTTWRQTVWREGFELLISKPRHLVVGVGMDSIKAHWRQWGLFDNGRIPIGHMHSNLLEIALERGIPALLVWLTLMGLYGRLLIRTLKRLRNENDSEGTERLESARFSDSYFPGAWADRGIALGALGGLVGFFSSGIVHYNWGDSEVIMIFYFIMGLGLVLERDTRLATEAGKKARSSAIIS
jgi:O-Antigen ligase